ncbi:hypothetical protein HY488_01730 [Candidatus Woesearchaeota archaeon]|nr:hypothetical protein [Candidatus Woesearchaeota archaeon]
MKMKKAQGQWSLIVKAALAVLLIIVGYFFIKTFTLERGGGALEKTGFGQFDDADQDKIQNFQDVCCAAVCNPRGAHVEQFGDYRGCTSQQGLTPCDFTGPQCNPRPAAAPPQGVVAGTPTPTPAG